MPNPTHKTTPYSRRLREEAFDLYFAGLSAPQVGTALRKRYGADAPHPSTLKRWMVQDRWASRRQDIRRHTARLDDQARAADDTRMLTALTSLRETLVTAGSELPARSAEGAVYALAALQKIIDRLSLVAIEERGPSGNQDPDFIMEAMFRAMSEDEVVGPVLDGRIPQIMDRFERYLGVDQELEMDRP